MNRENFIKRIDENVQLYIDNFDRFDSNPQLRVNPASFSMEIVNGSDMLAGIEDSNEAIENAAGAQGAATEVYTDFQVTQNPDFYPLKKLFIVDGQGVARPDENAVSAIADIYFK